MNDRARAQHVIDQVCAEGGRGEMFVAAIRTLDRNDLRSIDEFEPGSGWGGFDRRTDEIVLDPDFARTVDSAALRLVARHAIGCARFRSSVRRRLVDHFLPTIAEGCTAVGWASTPLAVPTPAPTARPLRIGSGLVRREAVTAGDAYCWHHSDEQERRTMITRIACGDFLGAPHRLGALPV